MIADKSCDIIVPVWDQPDFTKGCIESIIRNTSCPYRLIIVDNGSSEETASYLKGLAGSMGPAVTLINNETNLGFVKAVNQGMGVSKAPYVCIMNNDTVPAPGWLERMVEFASANEDVGLINPQCNGHGETPIDLYAKTLERNRGRYMEMNQCQGYCMLVKRELIDRIGYLDESFGIGGFDDTDYSMRAHMAGYRSVAVYDSYVYHRLHASFDKAGDREEWVKRNSRIYYGKWGKHLRIGVTASLGSGRDEAARRLANFVYGLAREWSWVHLWVNSDDKKMALGEIMKDAMEKEGLPPHQNIRMERFRLPDPIFGLAISGKLIERLRGRMRDKRFDAVISFHEPGAGWISPVAKAMGITFLRMSAGGRPADWRKEGRDTARRVKENRDHHVRTQG